MKRTIEPCIKRLMMKHGIKEPVSSKVIPSPAIPHSKPIQRKYTTKKGITLSKDFG